MSRENVVRSVVGRLSLRAPQAVSLECLHSALESVPALRDSNGRSPEELAEMTAVKASERRPNLTLNKILKRVLARGERGHDDYSLNVAKLAMAAPPGPRPGASLGLPRPNLVPEGEGTSVKGEVARKSKNKKAAPGKCGLFRRDAR